MSEADKHYTTYRGPLRVVRACNHCPHTESYPKGGRGRGYGLQQGSLSRTAMIRHIREAHPEVFTTNHGETR